MMARRIANISKAIPVVAAAMLLAGAIAAQEPGGGGMPNPSGPPAQGAPLPQPGMSDAASEQDPMRRMADQDFLRETLENSNAQVRLSQLAQQKSSSQDVQQFSRQMVKMQTQLSHQLEPAARQLNVNEPKGPSKKEKQAIAKLDALSGADFDTAYIKAIAKEQEQSLKAFKDESDASEDPALQQAAKQDSPVLSQNYEILRKLAAAHNVPLENKGKK